MISQIDGQKAKEELEKTGKLSLGLKDGVFELSPEDVEINMAQTEGYACQRYGGVTVALETVLTPELIEEGMVRELISKLQTMRKDNGFEVMDHVTVYIDCDGEMAQLVQRNQAYIKDIVLADEVVTGKTEGFSKEWNINGIKVTIGIK